MRNLLLTIRFVGTSYCGFQVQKNGISVAQRLQDAIEAVFGERLPIKGCSRTDAMVHANMFCVSFKTEKGIACCRIVPALNAHLPNDIAVYGCKEVAKGFHARYSCTGKEYLYKIDNGAARNPFLQERAYYYKHRLDEQAMDAAAQGFIGTYDFSALCSAGSSVKDKVRTVYACSVTREGDLVTISISGDGFLYNMVRIVAGTLLWAGEKGLTAQDIKEIILSGDRSKAGPTAPPYGLYLNRVFYDGIEG
ncbi:tRNA pseudouridine(38-40) synthase TruA [Acetanaerobacterium elongatum]|uniref:tRNA pseudouridine synthase A n=1 Tax=Acetanaerobacterium elongatum TaxID=258515 RepID=A0A1G9V8K0_9FIRM|nr:tRNA pseudouridine(38-40) synthase TruA [Acetanaerobacterium elongatum]SDM68386.1 tRNA pseudouridine38-40 synthase [Acetanaerobacterium elongatum]